VNQATAIAIGILLGLVSGLVPGMHHNFITTLIVSQYTDYWLLPLVISMLISSQFFEFLRSIFLFVPEEGNVLAMHPIFRFVKEGKALVALKLCTVGLIVSLIVGIVLSPLLIKIVPFIYSNIKRFVPYALAVVVLYLIIRDKNKIAALLIFILSGVVGYFGLKHLNQPLLILLTGFFGISILLQINQKIERQIKSYRFKIQKKSICKGTIAALFSSFILAFIPAIGPSQASLFSRGFLKSKEDFLIAIGAISGFDIILSMVLLFTIGKARIGSLEIIGGLFSFDFKTFVISLIILLSVGIISYFISLKLGKIFVGFSEKINYKILSLFVALAILFASFYFDGFLGVLFLILSTGIGMLAMKLKTNLSHCMGSLVIPVLMYFFL